MRYPNLRYGNPEELRHYLMHYGDDISLLARVLRRSERSVKDWLSGASKVPWWVPEILRLRQMEHAQMVYQMTGRQTLARLGVVKDGTVIDAGTRFKSPPAPLPEPLPADIFELRVG